MRGFDFYSQRMFGAMADAVSREIVREGIRKGESDDEIRDKATKGAWLTSVLGAGGIVGAGAYANHRINKKTDKSVEKVTDVLKKHSEPLANIAAEGVSSMYDLNPELVEKMAGGKEKFEKLVEEFKSEKNPIKGTIEEGAEELSKKGKEFLRERTKKLRRGIMGGAIGLGALNIMGSSIRGSQNAEDAIQNRKLYRKNG
jgi:hypothetical protein